MISLSGIPIRPAARWCDVRVEDGCRRTASLKAVIIWPGVGRGLMIELFMWGEYFFHSVMRGLSGFVGLLVGCCAVVVLHSVKVR